MKFLTLKPNEYPSSYGQLSADFVKWPLLRSPEKYSHA